MRSALLCAAAVLIGSQAAPASAGVYTDDLTRCIVARSSDADKLALMRWMFSAMSAHPAVQDLAKTSPDQRAALSVQAGNMMIRLLADDCHAQSVAALKYEGGEAIRSSFEILGKIAMQGLMSDPSVAQGVSGLNTPEATEKFNALAKEAGVAAPASPAK